MPIPLVRDLESVSKADRNHIWLGGGWEQRGREESGKHAVLFFCTLIPTFLLPSKELLDILHDERFLAPETVKTV